MTTLKEAKTGLQAKYLTLYHEYVVALAQESGALSPRTQTMLSELRVIHEALHVLDLKESK